MNEQAREPARPEAWGDVHMPERAQARRARRDDAATAGGHAEDVRATGAASGAAPDPTLAEDRGRYAIGATTSTPVVGPGYTWLPLGPGNEAMEGGASPAPRGYTGGAMGRVVAGLSVSFSEAARGAPPAGGPGLYTPAEAATTFRGSERDAPPGAGHTPGPTPTDAPEERAGGPTQA